jgi:hypothetical protein
MKQSFLDSLLAEVQTRFYQGVPEREFYAQRRGLIRALTWPAVWWRKRGFQTEITPDHYRGIILKVLGEVATHADQVKVVAARAGESGFFPAYLLKCLQNYYGYHGESLYESAKPLRDGLAPGDSIAIGDRVDFGAVLKAATRNAAAAQPREVLDLAVLAAARDLVAVKRPAKAAAPAKAAPAREAELF